MMTEHDIRRAFEHLKEDVMQSVQTEERLDDITRRRRWVRPASLAFAGAAAMTVIVGAAVLAFRPNTVSDTVPPATASTTAPQTSAAPSTEFLDPALMPGDVVIADPRRVPTPEGESGTMLPVFDANGGFWVYPADVVVGDGAGGVFAQVGTTIEWRRHESPVVTLLDADDLPDTDEAVRLRLHDAAEIEGKVTVVLVVAGGMRESGPEDVYQEVWLLDADTGEVRPVYRMGAWESNILRVSVANGTMVLTGSSEGETWFRFLDTAGAPIDITDPNPVGPESPWARVDQGVLSPEGSTLAFLEFDAREVDGADRRFELVVWDLEGGVEVQRLVIEMSGWVGRMDYDGTGAVLGLTASGGVGEIGPVLEIPSIATGTIVELAAIGTPSLIK